jgi:WD40 repeat protein
MSTYVIARSSRIWLALSFALSWRVALHPLSSKFAKGRLTRIMADKRKSPPASNGSSYMTGGDGSGASSSLIKRQRQGGPEEEDGTMQIAISSSNGANSKGLVRSVKRTSSLSSPIIALTGAHGGEILDVKFSPDGQMIAAASSDRTICECKARYCKLVWYSQCKYLRSALYLQ